MKETSQTPLLILFAILIAMTSLSFEYWLTNTEHQNFENFQAHSQIFVVPDK